MKKNGEETGIEIELGDRRIGPGQPVFIVAEIGINHNGDMVLARESIVAAAEAGADSVKFQNYRTEDFISDQNLMLDYRSQGKDIVESQYDLFKRCELDRDQFTELKAEAVRCGLDFHGTPTNVEGVRDLEAIGCRILKNGSDYLTHLDLIRTMGETGLTTVVSTGMATLAEIDEAVRCFRQTGNEKLILLHCTSSYPTPPEDVNLARLPILAGATGALVGLSDHSAGITAAVGATVLGACWIEKHFTLDRKLAGPDHWFSSDPVEFDDLVSAVRAAEKMIGSSSIAPTQSELLSRQNFRLSCVAANDLLAGHALTRSDIAFQRPGTGISPAQEWLLRGRVLRQEVNRGHVFAPGDFR